MVGAMRLPNVSQMFPDLSVHFGRDGIGDVNRWVQSMFQR